MSQAPPSPRRQGRPPVYWPDTSADLFSQPPATPAPEPPLPSHPEDECFARGNEEGTLAPSSFDDGEMDVDEPAPTPPSPAQLRRRARLRRLVSGLIGTVSIAMTLAGVRAFFARSRARRPVDNAFTVRQQVVPSIETGTPAPVQNLTLGAPAAIEPSPVLGEHPTTKADVHRLIQRGRIRDAIAAAQEALATDPSDAETYLLLGAALQETGKW